MSIFSLSLIIFIASFLGLFFIFLRNLPLLVDFKPEVIAEEKKLIKRLKFKLSNAKRKFKKWFERFTEKKAHQLRVLILKIDNLLISYIKKIQIKKLHSKKISFFKKRKGNDIKNNKL